MILECPECRTRYLVPDSAIGVSGRVVRCANCRHSWFQDADARAIEAMPTETPAEPAPPPAAPSSAAPAPADAPVVLAPAEPPVESAPKPAADVDYDAFAHRPPFRPRRNHSRRWTIAAVAAGLLMLVAVAAIIWMSAPGLAQQLGLSFGPAESPLRLVDNPIERREMANGSELFAVSGKVLNPSGDRQRVPDIRADLRDAQGRIVFSWTITPQQRSLGPKGSIDFNSAKLDVPANSKRLELSFVGENGK
ncbi:MJ0042-type zinc finger domain-containing protein [Sphingomonas sp. TX0543]|uniref:zinc-ribbon domain-containing protein n=1 Tax=unclassified Sphingomonas TaxID=196159 RepID=UPI0010F9C4C3|nr:zinc-ribbon domain-containing protein [Sphingomonas sp. 3P27F8]